MLDFIINCLLWVCALYGLVEIIKNILYIHSCNSIKTEGIHMIIAVKNQENKIEGFLRSLTFRILYGKEDCIDNLIILDLNSTDKTKKIIENYSVEHPCVKIINWTEFEELFSPNNSKF